MPLQDIFASDAANDELKVSRLLKKVFPKMCVRIRDRCHAAARLPGGMMQWIE